MNGLGTRLCLHGTYASWNAAEKDAAITEQFVVPVSCSVTFKPAVQQLKTPCQALTLTQGKLSGEPSQLSWDSICFCNNQHNTHSKIFGCLGRGK